MGDPISASVTLIVALASSATAKYVFEYEAPFLLSLALSIIVFLILAPLDLRKIREPDP